MQLPAEGYIDIYQEEEYLHFNGGCIESGHSYKQKKAVHPLSVPLQFLPQNHFSFIFVYLFLFISGKYISRSGLYFSLFSEMENHSACLFLLFAYSELQASKTSLSAF